MMACSIMSQQSDSMNFATPAWWTFLAMLVIHWRQGREQNSVCACGWEGPLKFDEPKPAAAHDHLHNREWDEFRS